MQAERDAQLFEAERPRLTALAYRLLGSRAEAEDAVQDAWLRFQRHARNATEALDSPQAWLTTVLTRLCLDGLKSARARRETYVGPWLPEPLAANDVVWNTPHDPDSLSLAFLVALETLTPLERAAFLLHEVFDYDWPEVATVLGREPAACRQLGSRAKGRLRDGRPRFRSDPAAQRRLLEGFVLATLEGDLPSLERLLTEDCECSSDGGGKARAALRVVRGASKVARLVLGLARKNAPHTTASIVELHGEPALALFEDGAPHSVTWLEIREGRIAAVRSVRNPDKLRCLFEAAR